MVCQEVTLLEGLTNYIVLVRADHSVRVELPSNRYLSTVYRNPPNRHKKKPPIEISDNKSTTTFTFSTPSPSSTSSPSSSLFGIGEKRGHP